MKRTLTTALIALLAFVPTACGGDEDQPSEPAAEETFEPNEAPIATDSDGVETFEPVEP